MAKKKVKTTQKVSEKKVAEQIEDAFLAVTCPV